MAQLLRGAGAGEDPRGREAIVRFRLASASHRSRPLGPRRLDVAAMPTPMRHGAGGGRVIAGDQHGTMPAARQASIVARPPAWAGRSSRSGRAGSAPSSRSCRSPARACRLGDGQHAVPGGGESCRPRRARVPARVSGLPRRWRRGGRTASGEPLTMTQDRPPDSPGSACTVVMRCAPLSNGTSQTRGWSVSNASRVSPAFPAAASSAASVGSPSAPHAAPRSVRRHERRVVAQCRRPQQRRHVGCRTRVERHAVAGHRTHRFVPVAGHVHGALRRPQPADHHARPR